MNLEEDEFDESEEYPYLDAEENDPHCNCGCSEDGACCCACGNSDKATAKCPKIVKRAPSVPFHEPRA